MRKLKTLVGQAAALPIENLDTDQIMPKQFLHGIDKSGLDRGLLYDLRFDAQGNPRADFVLNRPERANTSILVSGANFGCGSSREHAVWGLQQYGIEAVIAPSFGEIFYSNAMNNQLLLVMLPPACIAALMADVEHAESCEVRIDLEGLRVRSTNVDAPFEISARHRHMQMEGLDVIGLSLTYTEQIAAFAESHWRREPWVRDVASGTVARLGRAPMRGHD